MLKKIIVVVLTLLTGSVNADTFQALKNVAAQLEKAQKSLEKSDDVNTYKNEQASVVAVEQASAQVVEKPLVAPIEQTIEKSSEPKFNSLAEEAAYKKRLEEEKKSEIKKIDDEIITKILPRIERLQIAENSFYEKYLVKHSDTQESIDDKFKNRIQLYQDLQKDFIVLDNERKDIYSFLDNNLLRSNIHLSQEWKDYFKKSSWHETLFTVFMNAPYSYPNGYILQCMYRGTSESNYKDEIYIDTLRTKRDGFKNINNYENYLKCLYITFQEKVDERAQEIKRIQAQKEQQTKLANEQKERQKVQGACQAWRTKANKQVYSLGVGDQIVSKAGILYIIRGVEANTFLINVGGLSVYVQKSEYVPYSSIKSAPSKYCYQ